MPNFPDLSNADLISIDVETYDPDLKDKGIGVTRNGYIVGVVVTTRETNNYYPVRHEGGGNLDRELVWNYLNEVLSRPIPKTGANLSYDLAYLWKEGINVSGPFWDVQIAEPLLDENKFSYSLDSIAQERLGKGKNEEEMEAFIRVHYGVKEGKEKSYIYKCPAHIVEPYALEDGALPIQIIDQQLKEIAKEELDEVWQMECDLLPILVRMHLQGIKTDPNKAEKIKREWSQTLRQLESSFNGVNPKSSKQLAAYCDTLGISYPKTAKGSPSFTASVMKSLQDQVPMFKAMLDSKKYSHFLNTFIEGYILGSHVNGRIHGSFNQLKSDEYGTVSGRLSSSHPCLQNIPNPEKDEFFSKECRGLFLPEEGQEWFRLDYSQIEYRLLIHYASSLPGGVADVARQMYIDKPDTDFHQMCADLTGVGRKQAKNLNFGLCYGMGTTKLAASLGLSISTAKEIFSLYHQKAPFAKAFLEAAMQRASNRGYIRTISGRKRRFAYWESSKFIAKEDKKDGKTYMYKDRQTAVEQFGSVKRANTHAAANAVLQGSSADLTKRAMVQGYKSGIYSVLGYPLVTVHDELGFSVDTSKKEHLEAAKEMEQIMIDSYKLKVPILVGTKFGKSWGEAS